MQILLSSPHSPLPFYIFPLNKRNIKFQFIQTLKSINQSEIFKYKYQCIITAFLIYEKVCNYIFIFKDNYY